MTKKIIDVKRKHQELSYDLSGTVDEVIAVLQRLKDKAPEGAEVILNYDTDYGSYGDRDRDVVFVYDRRLETDIEYGERLAQESLRADQQLAQKRAQLEALKKELGE